MSPGHGSDTRGSCSYNSGKDSLVKPKKKKIIIFSKFPLHSLRDKLNDVGGGGGGGGEIIIFSKFPLHSLRDKLNDVGGGGGGGVILLIFPEQHRLSLFFLLQISHFTFFCGGGGGGGGRGWGFRKMTIFLGVEIFVGNF